MNLKKICKEAKNAAAQIALMGGKNKNHLLRLMAKSLDQDWRKICRANEKDLANAGRFGLTQATKDRLYLNQNRVRQMAASIRQVASLKDPVGQVLKRWRRPNGMWIEKVSVPLGVILVIYESRPNVTADCASLCIKSGNAVILRGGRESLHSNTAVVSAFRRPLQKAGLPKGTIGFIDQPSHQLVNRLLKMDDFIDLVIPRGGEALIRKVAKVSSIPVIKHYRGNCHVYVDRDADLKMAEELAYNSKVQRPGVCNAMETLLVHQAVAPKLLSSLGKRFEEAAVQVRGCPKTRRILSHARPAKDRDWYEEYLNKTLAIKIVDSLDQAIQHISRYGSQHTDAIVTRNHARAEKFIRRVDSSSVFVNVSTRLADGGIYGFGSEVGISTDKLHARGPMGIADLTSYKYVVRGTGQIRK